MTDRPRARFTKTKGKQETTQKKSLSLHWLTALLLETCCNACSSCLARMKPWFSLGRPYTATASTRCYSLLLQAGSNSLCPTLHALLTEGFERSLSDVRSPLGSQKKAPKLLRRSAKTRDRQCADWLVWPSLHSLVVKSFWSQLRAFRVSFSPSPQSSDSEEEESRILSAYA